MAAGCLLGTSAVAGTSVVAFNIPSKPIGVALVDFAVQAGISLGLKSASTCTGPAPALVGPFTIGAGLDRLLAGSGCGYRRIDERAYDIVGLPASAQPSARGVSRVSPPVASGRSLAELLVVATKRPTRADRLAYPVSSVSASDLQRQGVRDLSDLAALIPAMTVTNLGMGRDKVLLRGLSDGPLTGLTQSLVGIYLDDTRLTFNAPDPDLRLVDVDSVEVLRGPQGALYGSGSLTGVVRLVSAAPDATRVVANLAATGSQTKGGRPSASVDAVFNTPVLGGRAALRLVGYHEVDGGYIRDLRLGDDHANRTERDGGRVTAKLDLDNRWSVSVGALLQNITSADTQYAEAARGRNSRAVNVREPHDNNFREINVRIAGAPDWGAVRASIAYIRHGLFSRYDATNSPPSPVPPGPAAFDERDRIDAVVTEGSLMSGGASRLQWLVGAFYAHTWEAAHSTLTSLAPPTSVRYEELRHDSLDEGALYGQATERLSRGLEVTGGGRLFVSVDRVTSADTAYFGQPSFPFSGRVSEVGFAPKVVLADQVAPWLLVYAQAGEGYRAPGINTAAASNERLAGPGGHEPLRAFKGDELWSLEAGAKLTGLDGRLRFDVAIYEAEWRNIQSDQLLASGIPYTANVGHARNLGFEAEGTFRSGGLELRTELLFNDPVLDKANPAFPILTENGLGVVPNVSFGLFAHYDWRLGNRWSMALDTRWAYVGASHLMLNIASLPRMGDYVTGRVAATLSNDHWRFTLAMDNPADAQGDTFAYGNPFTVRYRRQITPLRPRTVTFGVAVSY